MVPLKVHPRSRGEYICDTAYQYQPLGSPPLTRGILLAKVIFFYRYRFTPAHAGNTVSCRYDPTVSRVHPRSRGEYIDHSKWFFKIEGSPPLTRGILNSVLNHLPLIRFTPAHAGNTTLPHISILCKQVHPRSRGEYPRIILYAPW